MIVGAPGTPLKVSLAAVAASVLLLLIVVELIRSRRLRERYALLWLLTGLVLLALLVLSTIAFVALLTVSVAFSALVAARYVLPAADRLETALGGARP